MNQNEKFHLLNESLLKLARSSIVDSGNLSAAIAFILESAAETTDIGRISVWFYNKEKTKMICFDLFEKNKNTHSSGMEINSLEYPHYFSSLASERVVTVTDASNDIRTKEFANNYLIPNNISSLMDAPIRLSGEVIGVLCNEHVGDQQHSWSRDEIYFAGILSEIIARAISAKDKLEHQENLKKANCSLEKVNQELAVANQAKQDLFMLVSHELRAPINVIGLWAQLLQSKYQDQQTVLEGTQVISNNAAIQSRIINDLLDTSQILLGKMIIKKSVVDISLPLERAIQSARLMADKRNISIRYFNDGLPKPVYGDDARIEQILTNLLSNSIKFSPMNEEIKVSVSIEAGSTKVEVKDNGIGISPDQLSGIFDRYKLKSSPTTRFHSGLGIGLSIVKYLVNSHNGEIVASSDGIGKGSTFTFKIPIWVETQKSPPTDIHQPDKSIHEKPLKGLRILLVDDDPDTCEIFQILLDREGAEVFKCESATAALECMSKNTFDVVLSDLAMPGTDGFTMIQKIRASNSVDYKNIPAIAVSAFSDPTNQARALECGFDELLEKPISVDRCVNKILEVIDKKHRDHIFH